MGHSVPEFVRVDLCHLGIELSEDMIIKLARYLDELLETNRHSNLTAIRDRDQAWRRHIIDSLTVLPVIANLGSSSAMTDVGSGGGLPGIPIAVTKPHLQITLIEATGKKTRYLERCVNVLALQNVNVVRGRAEDLARDPRYRQRYDVAVCRALGPLRTLLECTLPLVKVGGEVLAMMGPSVVPQLAEADKALSVLGAGEIKLLDAYPESFGRETRILRVPKLLPTPDTYPRTYALIRQRPL